MGILLARVFFRNPETPTKVEKTVTPKRLDESGLDTKLRPWLSDGPAMAPIHDLVIAFNGRDTIPPRIGDRTWGGNLSLSIPRTIFADDGGR